MFRGSQISSVVILFLLTVHTKQAVTFVDAIRADGQAVTGRERFDFSGENRVTGRLCLQAKATHLRQ